MRVLITGGAGFIGSHLAEALVSEHDVVVVDNFSTGRLENLESINDSITIINMDIAQDPECLVDVCKDIDSIYHLAGLADIVPSIVHPATYFRSNVTGTLNVLMAAVKANVKKLVYTASSSCYGDQISLFPTPESSEINVKYPYALTKYMGEQLCFHWSKVYGIHASSCRLFNVYGPRSRTNGAYGAVMGVFLAQYINSMPLTIVGDGTQTRDFTFISDVISGLKLVHDNGHAGEAYNIGSGNTVSISYLAELIGGSYVNIPKRPAEPDCTYADIQKVSEIGYAPSVPIELGIEILKSNLNLWSNAPVWTPDSIARETSEWFDRLS